jgi:hypothetical protein
LKMPGPCGVISIRGDVKRAFDCDRESCETTNRLIGEMLSGLLTMSGRVARQPID